MTFGKAELFEIELFLILKMYNFVKLDYLKYNYFDI